MTHNSEQAYSEGWDIFNGNEIQRLDSGPITIIDGEHHQTGEPAFVSDAAALAYCIQRANEGSAYHANAVAMHRAQEAVCA